MTIFTVSKSLVWLFGCSHTMQPVKIEQVYAWHPVYILAYSLAFNLANLAMLVIYLKQLYPITWVCQPIRDLNEL